MTIAVLDYGSGNLRSVAHAIAHVGGEPEVTGDPERVLSASGLIVPGVGHFGACMAALRERGLDATIKEFVATGRPVFGVCVGMQVLFDGSEEAPGVAGLGLLNGFCKRLPDDVTVPHMGWDEVIWRHEPLHRYVADIPSTWFYFAHSYAPVIRGALGTTPYGMLISAAVVKENVFATQFHPEKSGRWGLKLYAALVGDAER